LAKLHKSYSQLRKRREEEEKTHLENIRLKILARSKCDILKKKIEDAKKTFGDSLRRNIAVQTQTQAAEQKNDAARALLEDTSLDIPRGETLIKEAAEAIETAIKLYQAQLNALGADPSLSPLFERYKTACTAVQAAERIPPSVRERLLTELHVIKDILMARDMHQEGDLEINFPAHLKRVEDEFKEQKNLYISSFDEAKVKVDAAEKAFNQLTELIIPTEWPPFINKLEATKQSLEALDLSIAKSKAEALKGEIDPLISQNTPFKNQWLSELRNKEGILERIKIQRESEGVAKCPYSPSRFDTELLMLITKVEQPIISYKSGTEQLATLMGKIEANAVFLKDRMGIGGDLELWSHRISQAQTKVNQDIEKLRLSLQGEAKIKETVVAPFVDKKDGLITEWEVCEGSLSVDSDGEKVMRILSLFDDLSIEISTMTTPVSERLDSYESEKAIAEETIRNLQRQKSIAISIIEETKIRIENQYDDLQSARPIALPERIQELETEIH
jgi:hypothetical protein